MRSLRAALLACLTLAALLSASPPAAGQAVPGALYITDELVTDGTGCNGANHYAMSDVLPAEPGKAYAGASGGGFACSMIFDYTATQAGVLVGDINLVLTLSCDVPTGTIEVDYSFAVAGEVVGSERTSVTAQCTGSSSALAYAKTFDGDDTPIAVGDLITLTMSVFGPTGEPGTPSANWHFRVGGDNPGRIYGLGLPGGSAGEAPAPSTTFTDLDGEDASISQQLNGSSARYQYNWTTNLTEVQLIGAVDSTSGFANVTIVDGSNQTVANETFTGIGNQTLDLAGEAGNWTIVVVYDNFTGNLTLDLGAPAPEESGSTTATTTSQASTTVSSAERTGSFPLKYEKDTPMSGAVPLALGLVVLAFAMFRRRLA